MVSKLRVGMKIATPYKRGDGPMDTTYVVERIRRVDGKVLVGVRTELQRCFGTMAPQTTWDFTMMQARFTAGTMQEIA
jgi:hypothetical protein